MSKFEHLTHDKDISVTYTPSDSKLINEMVVVNTLSPDSLKKVIESVQACNELVDMDIVDESNIIRMRNDNPMHNAKMAAVFTVAAEENDTNFRKLVSLWGMEKIIESALVKEYGEKAERRLKMNVHKMDKAAFENAELKAAIETAKAELKM